MLARLKLAIGTAAVGIAAMLGGTYHIRQSAISKTPIQQFTVASAAQRVRGARGHVLVLVLYRAKSDDPYVVADLRRWTTQVAPPKVELLALAVGKRHDAQYLFRYGHELGLARLAPEWLAPWEAGTLDSTLTDLGIKIGEQRSIPLVAVIDSKGTVTAQWQGEPDYMPIIAAAKAARQG
jgi:hypothetical protein